MVQCPAGKLAGHFYARAEMIFFIDGDCFAVLAGLFQADDTGHLRLGWSGVSKGPATLNDLVAAEVLFRDYIMEGFVEYSVSAVDRIPGCMISVQGSGSNRDQYIPPQIRHFITAAGFSIVAENSN